MGNNDSKASPKKGESSSKNAQLDALYEQAYERQRNLDRELFDMKQKAIGKYFRSFL